jgi:hypothetical protein
MGKTTGWAATWTELRTALIGHLNRWRLAPDQTDAQTIQYTEH